MLRFGMTYKIDPRLNSAEALRVLNMTGINTLRDKTRRGQLAVIKDGRRSFFLLSELERHKRDPNAISPHMEQVDGKWVTKRNYGAGAADISGNDEPVTLDEIRRRAKEAADYADRGLDWPPRQ